MHPHHVLGVAAMALLEEHKLPNIYMAAKQENLTDHDLKVRITATVEKFAHSQLPKANIPVVMIRAKKEGG